MFWAALQYLIVYFFIEDKNRQEFIESFNELVNIKNGLEGLEIINTPKLTVKYSKEFESIECGIKLIAGWNSSSIPIRPYKLSIDSLFPTLKHLMYSYTLEGGYMEPSQFSWKNGYYIRSEIDTTITINGIQVPLNSIVKLNEGWNFVGYPLLVEQLVEDVFMSVSEDIELIATLEENEYRVANLSNIDVEKVFVNDNSPKITKLEVIQPGVAYWVKAKRTVDWIIR